MIPGINEVQTLATKYSKAQLAQMAQNGLIDPTKAVMAGMMIDRISKQNMEPPRSTVAQDVMAPPAPQMGMPQGQPQQAPSAGVAGIPAPNMESMAGGGIVAFNDGGDVPGYADAGYVDSTWENLKPAPRKLAGSMGEFFGNMIDQGGQRVDPVTGEPISLGEFLRRQQAEQSKIYAPQAQAIAAQAPAPVTQAPTFKDARTKPTPEVKAPGLAAAPRQMGPRATAPTTPAPTAATGLGSLTSKAEELRKAAGYDDVMSGIKNLRTDAEAANKREEELAAKRPEFTPYEKYKADLDKEAAGVEDKKSENTKMAIINAGLAIMSGKSQYALQNIGEGAQVGTKQYAEGLKEIAKADKERQKALAEIEQAQNLYKEGKYDRAEARAAKGEQRLLDASKTALSVTGPIVNQNMSSLTQLVTNENTIGAQERIATQNRASQERIAGMQATIQREVNTISKQNALDANQAKTLVDASNKYLADFKDNAAYVGKPEQLTADAIAYGKKVALSFMPNAKGNPSQDPALAAALAKYKTTPGTK